jgi:CheY-like chemotaxis protein
MNKTIVVIDDDQDDLEVMRESISMIDPSLLCLGFISGDEVIRKIANRHILLPDYIFIDINMPGKTGPECLRDLRKLRELDNTTIIIYSTTLPETVSKQLLKAGANFTFQKPTSVREYSKTLEHIFSSKL